MKELQLIPRVVAHKLFRFIGVPKAIPVSMTVTVTNQCNSRCKTCMIWKFYRDYPDRRNNELTLEEYEAIFRCIGNPIFWITLSGGEPCLRPDLVDIAAIIHKYCNPAILNLPVNGLLPTITENTARKILDIYSQSTVIVNLSLDEIGGKHDEIRGVPGNFEKAMDTYRRLVELKKEYSNLEVGVHSVASKFNIAALMGMYEYVTKELVPDSYICEIAEHRNELFNTSEDIAPDIPSYESFIGELSRRIREDSGRWKGMPRFIQAFRLEYYKLLVRELKARKQVIPCYAGFINCHISCYGEVWPCCILADEASMGNLREVNYDFKRIWTSQKAATIREMIKKGRCSCSTSTANNHYTSMLCSPATTLRVIRNALRM